ncbi:MAG TPA: hypothetical protein PLU95_13460 [Syntrophales bacterium]|nr:hypothetical protein [Syntrophales bacterium]HPN10311.1 hypothetical protein [Syntrophales bacterium]HQK78873.1 hypothetical protein [Syntrophales bacterium]
MEPILPPYEAEWGVRTEGHNASGVLKDTAMFLTSYGEGIFVGSLNDGCGKRRTNLIKAKDHREHIIRYLEARRNLGYQVTEIWTLGKGWQAHPATMPVEVPQVRRVRLSTTLRWWQEQGPEWF